MARKLTLAYGQDVEFTGPAACRVIYPTGAGIPRSIKIAKGGEGTVVDASDYETLPGDVPVKVEDPTLDRHLIISVREGLLAAFEIESDSRSGNKVFKHYRNMTVKVEPDEGDDA